MLRKLQNLGEISVMSLNDDQISLLNSPENRNINYEEIELEMEEII